MLIFSISYVHGLTQRQIKLDENVYAPLDDTDLAVRGKPSKRSKRQKQKSKW